MESIGNIKKMENRLGGRKPDHGRARSMQNNPRNDAAPANDAAAADHQSSPESGISIGQKVDTTA